MFLIYNTFKIYLIKKLNINYIHGLLLYVDNLLTLQILNN